MLISCLGREEASELVSDVALFVQIVKKGDEEKARKSSARRPSARIGRMISPSLPLFLSTRRSEDPGWVTYGVLARLQRKLNLDGAAKARAAEPQQEGERLGERGVRGALKHAWPLAVRRWPVSVAARRMWPWRLSLRRRLQMFVA